MEESVSILGIENITLFVTTGIVLNLYPGPDILYIIGRSLSQGRGAGIAGALGIGSGTIWCLVIALFASSFGRRLNRSSGVSRQLKRVNGFCSSCLALNWLLQSLTPDCSTITLTAVL